ncbi:DUF3397 domain-containing protein [Neobacillus jeddahensis]|uniref:DUF3397 domain-containing protein n=1 Tax=Neobacillus jeddahensis TaxID=1461580 RepID=UPI00058FC659|nr:DUF3397 domain-containing protein [Neobacillus jeddahensis]
MSTLISAILTFFFTIPFLGSVLVFLVIKLITKNTRVSLLKALDYTTILFIISVHFLIITLLGKSLFGFILLIMILVAMMFVFVHWKVREEIVMKKVLKGFWRFSFILFFLAYITLTFYGLVSRAITFSFSS